MTSVTSSRMSLSPDPGEEFYIIKRLADGRSPHGIVMTPEPLGWEPYERKGESAGAGRAAPVTAAAPMELEPLQGAGTPTAGEVSPSTYLALSSPAEEEDESSPISLLSFRCGEHGVTPYEPASVAEWAKLLPLLKQASSSSKQAATPLTQEARGSSTLASYVEWIAAQGFGSNRRALQGCVWAMQALRAMNLPIDRPLLLDESSLPLGIGLGLHLWKKILCCEGSDEERISRWLVVNSSQFRKAREYYVRALHRCGQVGRSRQSVDWKAACGKELQSSAERRIQSAYSIGVSNLPTTSRPPERYPYICDSRHLPLTECLIHWKEFGFSSSSSDEHLFRITELAYVYLHAVQEGVYGLYIEEPCIDLTGIAALYLSMQMLVPEAAPLSKWAWRSRLPEAQLRCCVMHLMRRLEIQFFPNPSLASLVKDHLQPQQIVSDLAIEMAIRVQELAVRPTSYTPWKGSEKEHYVPLEWLIHRVLDGEPLGAYDQTAIATCAAIALAMLSRARSLPLPPDQLPAATVAALRLASKLQNECCQVKSWSRYTGIAAKQLLHWERQLVNYLDGDVGCSPETLNVYLKRLKEPPIKLQPMEQLPPPLRFKRSASGR
jgi:hypothetical protein